MPSINPTYSEPDNLTVSYPMRESTQKISKAEYHLIKRLPQDRVVCIKFIKDQYNLGLYESKMIVDTIHGCDLTVE